MGRTADNPCMCESCIRRRAARIKWYNNLKGKKKKAYIAKKNENRKQWRERIKASKVAVSDEELDRRALNIRLAGWV